MADRKRAKVMRRPALALGIFSFVLAVNTFAEADQPATDASKQNEAAISQTIDVMKARNTNQAAAKDRYDQMIESAKAEHKIAMDTCESFADEPKKACEERADAEFSAAKSKANHALEAERSAQP